jgi:hypothetical protein
MFELGIHELVTTTVTLAVAAYLVWSFSRDRRGGCRMIDYSEENDLASTEWRGNDQVAISEDQEAWRVNAEAGDDVERCASKAEAIERAKARNAAEAGA